MNKNDPINEPITAIVADDEPLARKKIRRFLEDEKDINIIGECGNGREAVEAVKKFRPVLLFLDIEMPEMNGIEVIKEIPAEKMPLIVFITAYDQYAVKAFEYHALDYLLKPFNRIRFKDTLNRVRNNLKMFKEKGPNSLGSILKFIDDIKRKEKYLDRIMVKSTDRMIMLKVEKITWFESDRNYINISTTKGEETYRIRETLQNLETRLDPGQFIRINRSTIINIDSIKEMQPLFKNEYVVILKNGKRFILNKKYFLNLEKILKK